MDLIKAQALFQSAKYTELVKGIKGSPGMELLEIKGFALQKLGRFEEALEVWNELISKDQHVASYYNERGVCKFQMRFRHAIDDFDKAISLEPDSAYFYSCRAYIKDKNR